MMWDPFSKLNRRILMNRLIVAVGLTIVGAVGLTIVGLVRHR